MSTTKLTRTVWIGIEEVKTINKVGRVVAHTNCNNWTLCYVFMWTFRDTYIFEGPFDSCWNVVVGVDVLLEVDMLHRQKTKNKKDKKKEDKANYTIPFYKAHSHYQLRIISTGLPLPYNQLTHSPPEQVTKLNHTNFFFFFFFL